ncbi:MAG: OsmC family protein [Anaerolineae bacterium]
MSAIKTITLEARQVSGYKIEAKARDHVMYIDQPQAVGGTDSGPTPLEYQFASLASCIITISHIVAQQKRIKLRGINVEVEGPIDTEYFQGKTTEGRAGFTTMCVKVHYDADLTQEEKEQLLAEVDRRCPISDNLHYTTPISFTVD